MIRNLKTVTLLLLVPLLLIGCTEDCNPLNSNINVDECRKDDNIFATLRDEQDKVRSLEAMLMTSNTTTSNLRADIVRLNSDIMTLNRTRNDLQGMVDTLTPENTRLAAIERRWDALTGQSNITHQLFLVNRTQGGTQANWTLPLINTTIHFQDPSGNNYTLEWQNISPGN
ncbi:MAG: hypothetical protein K0U41_03790 [Gammaproteobacteria bacterium]|nr:hypothetical protein [Gammaproteobacteria bacterium]